MNRIVIARTAATQERAARIFVAAVFIFAVGIDSLAAQAQEPSGIEAAAAVEKVLVDAIATSEKSVVAIARVHKDQPGETIHFEFHPDPFGRRVVPAAPLPPTDPNFIPNEYGAGVVVDRQGLILTAYQLLADESDYYVTTSDRRVYHAWVKAADPRSDLALLSLDGAENGTNNFTPIRFGDADKLRKGQIVISLGNPSAIARDGQASAAWGIIANLARKAPAMPEDSDPVGKRTLHHYGTLIQTDAKLNLGTSGGPLVNLKGEMIGLCTLFGSASGYETSAGYAIPVDATFRRVVDVLREGREVEYGFLGIQPGVLSPADSIAGLRGIRVDRIVPGTPAARYGLKSDDIVTTVDGKPIYDPDGLVLEVGKLPVAAETHLGVIRNGQKETVDVVLSKYPVRGKKIITVRPNAWRGIRVDYPSAYIDSDQSVRGLPIMDDAVVVSEVEPNTIASRAGVKTGMLINQVDGQAVRTPKEFQAMIAAKSGPVQLHLAYTEPSSAVVTVPGT